VDVSTDVTTNSIAEQEDARRMSWGF